MKYLAVEYCVERLEIEALWNGCEHRIGGTSRITILVIEHVSR